MQERRRTRIAWPLAAVLAGALAGPALADTPRTLDWQELIPPGWVPFDPFARLTPEELDDLTDDSELAEKLMREFELAQASAPVVGELDGAEVRIPGYVVPLDFEGTELREFLLVPYFGACIHVPPPPANQIVYVTTEDPYELGDVFDAVWVTGRLTAQGHLNEVGDAGYTLAASRIERYSE